MSAARGKTEYPAPLGFICLVDKSLAALDCHPEIMAGHAARIDPFATMRRDNNGIAINPHCAHTVNPNSSHDTHLTFESAPWRDLKYCVRFDGEHEVKAPLSVTAFAVGRA